MSEIETAAAAAKAASRAVAGLAAETKNSILFEVADAVERRAAEVLDANARDMEAAQREGLPEAKLRRLELREASIGRVCDGVRQVARLPDPLEGVVRSYEVPSGLKVEKVRTPLGVIAMIYEARPGVTIDAFALCFKAGNACLLKGGREANNSNRVLAKIARDVLGRRGVPEGALAAVTTSDREELKRLLALDHLIDLVIPRGGEGLIRFVHEHARVPTIQHFKGVCHIYVDASADLDMAASIVETAKASAPATCNAAECVLVHASVAGRFVPMLVERCARAGVVIRGDERVVGLAPSSGSVEPAAQEDWGREYLDLVLAARVVDSLEDSAEHIARYGSDHTEAIVTGDEAAAERFCRLVRSSCVLVNASTRFNDGFELGLGAEIGISTSRLHAYGPMGLEALTVERFVVRGRGQTR